jgi:hypothetical protein
MCPFCIGAAAWAAAGVVSAGGLGILAAVVRSERGLAVPERANPATTDRSDVESPDPSASDARRESSR